MKVLGLAVFRFSRRIWKRVLLFICAGSIVLFLSWGLIVDWLSPDVAAMVFKAMDGCAILDRNGKILRFLPGANGDFRLNACPASFPRVLKNAVLAAEDRRFFQHSGFDTLAIFRALWLNVSHNRILSGASTITQQLVRIVRPRPRTIYTKLSELILAAHLERQLTKEEILGAYLNLIPMGNNIRGAGLGAQLLFLKNVSSVSVAEAATLAAIPQAPARMYPRSNKGWKRLLARRNWIIGKMKKLGFISADEARRAENVRLDPRPRKLPFHAPHFVDWIISQQEILTKSLTTSLDVTVQAELERVFLSHRDRLSRLGANQAAGVVIDAQTLEILAMMGSFHYGAINEGYNNGCTALRSAGSTLKPFLYSLALDGGLNPASIIPDTKQNYRTPQGDYLPLNSNRNVYGPVSIRSALGNSLNISAVKMLNSIGVNSFFQYLVKLNLLKSDPNLCERYGLGLAIGNAEISLLKLVEAFASFAHEGKRCFIRYTPGGLIYGASLISPQTAYLILDILSDPSARLLTFGNPQFFSFGFPVALKTGTSTNYRDSWIIGMTPKTIIGIWVGNFDGKPTSALSGSTACGPIFHDLFKALEKKESGNWFSEPAGITSIYLCGISGETPTVFCKNVTREIWVKGEPKPRQCSFHLQSEIEGGYGPIKSHELPVEYADWIYQRRKKNITDSFKLSGNVVLNDNGLRPSVFNRFSDEVGVRLMGGATLTASPLDSIPSSSSSSSSQLIIRSNEINPMPGRLVITNPHDGDRFILNPGEDNIIKFQAIPESPFPEIIWLVDGEELARTSPPYETYWQPTRGKHSIIALGPAEEAALIQIFVE